jgi:hypothetical protein
LQNRLGRRPGSRARAAVDCFLQPRT